MFRFPAHKESLKCPKPHISRCDFYKKDLDLFIRIGGLMVVSSTTTNIVINLQLK